MSTTSMHVEEKRRLKIERNKDDGGGGGRGGGGGSGGGGGEVVKEVEEVKSERRRAVTRTPPAEHRQPDKDSAGRLARRWHRRQREERSHLPWIGLRKGGCWRALEEHRGLDREKSAIKAVSDRAKRRGRIREQPGRLRRRGVCRGLSVAFQRPFSGFCSAFVLPGCELSRESACFTVGAWHVMWMPCLSLSGLEKVSIMDMAVQAARSNAMSCRSCSR